MRIGFFLLLPFFLLRFGLLARLDQKAIVRAAHFAPLAGGERAAYWVYQAANVGILLAILLLPVHTAPIWLVAVGAVVYAAGLALLAGAVVSFARPDRDGMNRTGLYRWSRHPMYVAYFVYFIGCVLLTRSMLLLGLVLAFQIAAHWIIRAEERWCAAQFGQSWRQYCSRVRRYL